MLGGGLAGITAALRLTDAGCQVTLVERRKLLGGRAGSHIDPSTGQFLDNCQHVLLGCCTNLIDLYRRLGVSDLIEWHDTLHFLDRQGHHDVMSRSPLPAPAHLGASLARFRSLGWRAKWALARAVVALLRIAPDEQARWSERTFGEWLTAHHQPPELIDRFWNVIITSALNQSVREAAAGYAIQVFRTGFLGNRDSYRMGLASVPLVRLYEPARGIIEAAGGRLLLGTSVHHFIHDGRRIGGVELVDGTCMAADAYVSALPPGQLIRILPCRLCQEDERFGKLDQLRFSPILGIHLWFEGAVMELPHAIFLDSPLHWVFNRGMDATGCQHLHVVISAADDWMAREPDLIMSQVRNELAVYLPATRDARLTCSKVFKERRATFAPLPGVESIRPGARGAISNLFLAGDFCQTGWPATMEGAVRSGSLAAAALLEMDPPLTPDLPDAWLARRIQNL